MSEDKIKELQERNRSLKTSVVISTFTWVMAAIVIVCMGMVLWKKSQNEVTDLQKATTQLDECRNHNNNAEAREELAKLVQSLSTVVMEGNGYMHKAMSPPECPAPQACPSPLTEQMQEQADACAVRINEIQLRWDAKYQLVQEAIDKAKSLGVSPRLREWVGNSDAQMASREVALTFQEWREVAWERAKAADDCANQIADLVLQTDPVKRYREMARGSSEGGKLYEQLEAMYPRNIWWNRAELNLTREAFGCKDE